MSCGPDFDSQKFPSPQPSEYPPVIKPGFFRVNRFTLPTFVDVFIRRRRNKSGTVSVVVVIPGGVRKIGDGAFHGCTGLTSVVIPGGVRKIGDGAFHGCTGLTSVVIPDSVTEIGCGAFRGCIGLTSVVIPDSVTEIGWNAFSGCVGLTSIEILDGVTSIGRSAFYGCNLPESVKKELAVKFGSCIFDK